MQVIKVKIKLNSSYITPLQADTIFGALCWVVRYNYGVEYLGTFLKGYRQGRPPLILSNAFPGDLLPKPMIPFVEKPAFKDRDELINWSKESKKLKEIEFFAFDEFMAVLTGGRPFLETRPKPVREITLLHNQINRLRGTSDENGGLFEETEKYLDPKYGYLSIYIKTDDQFQERLPEIFTLLGETGIGKKKSTGKGSFKVISIEPFNGFEVVKNPNAFVSLSNFVPAPGDPVNGSYKTLAKYGKLGEEYSLTGNPFKRPLLMLKAGSVFKLEEPLRDYYGALIEDIAPAHPGAVQYGYAFPVPALLKII